MKNTILENIEKAESKMKIDVAQLSSRFYDITEQYLALVEVEIEEAHDGESATEYEARMTRLGYNWADSYSVVFPKESDTEQDHRIYCHLIEHISKSIWKQRPRKIAMLHIEIVPSFSDHTCIAQFNWRAPTAAGHSHMDIRERTNFHNFLAMKLGVYPGAPEE